MNDTVIMPAREDRFEKIFLDEKRWHSIGIDRRRISEIKWISVYRSKLRAITHIAEVASIEPWPNGKYVLNFAGPAKEIGHKRRTRNAKDSGIWIRSRRYTSKARLEKAKTLEEVF